MGPTNFIGGLAPKARQAHGFAPINDSKLILFGGTNAFLGNKNNNNHLMKESFSIVDLEL